MRKRMSGRIVLLAPLLAILLGSLAVVRPLSADGPIRVGIYQNEPLVFTDDDGHPSGFYVDLLEAMAVEEGWDLEYVECLFPDCLAMLERGDLDLMTAIAYSEERDERFDFNRETVLANWAQVYIRQGGPQSIPDLEGRTVAVVREDIYHARFRALIETFDVSCRFLEVDDYGPVLERVAAGEADAGIVARLYGLRHEGEYAVVRSPIVCCPSELRFAAPEGRNGALLEAIDRHIASWKEDPVSIYYQALDRWFAGAVAKPTLREQIPTWIQWGVLTIAAVAVLVILFNLLLRAQVRARTGELQKAEARYHGLFERIPIGLYSTTPDGEIVEANPALAELLGYPSHEALRGLNVREMYVDEQDRKRELARVDLEGEVRGYELQLRRADGTPIWVRDSSRAVRDRRGRVVRYEGALEDISERKAAERELERSEALFRALAEEALVGVYLIQDGRFRYVNPALARMFGYEPHEVIDRLGPLDLTAAEDRDLVAENVHKRIEGEVERIHYTFRGLRKDGTVFDCEVMGRRVEYEERPAILGTLLDISEQKRMEERRAARTRQQAALARLGMVALSERDLDAFLNEAVSVVATTLEVELCEVLEVLPRGEGLLLRAGAGWGEDVVGEAVAPADADSLPGYTLLSRGPVVVEDLRAETRFEVPSPLKEEGPVSGISVRIGAPDRPWGVLGVYATRPRRFEQEEVDFVQMVANILAQFIDRARAEEVIRQQAERLEALRQIGLELTAELDLESLLHSVVERAVDLIGGNFGGLYLYRSDQDVMEWTVAVGSLPTRLGTTLRRGEGLSGKIWETGKPMVVEDYRRWEGRAPIYDGYPYAAVVGAPIRWGEEFLGVINVASDRPGVFSSADAEVLDLFALQAAVAIRNAQQVAALNEERERLALLHRLGERLSASLDMHTVAQQALDDVVAGVGASKGVVLVWNPDIERLLLVAVSGYDAESVASLANRSPLPLGDGSLAGWVGANRQAVIVPDVTADERWMQVPGLDDWVRSALSVPLLSRGDLVGVMSIYSEREGAFGEDHLRLVESAAATVAAAIANAQLYEREREQRRLAEALGEATAAVGSTLDLDQVLDRILEQVERVVPCDATNFMLLEDDKARLVRWRGYEKFGTAVVEFVSEVVFPLSEVTNLRQMKETQEPILIPDTASYPDWVQVPEMAWLRSYAGVPIIVRGEVIGFLNVDSATPGFFTSVHLDPLRALADSAASAIANARLYREVRQRALEQETLRKAALALSAVRDPDEAVERILAELERVVPYDTASVQWLEGNLLRIVGGRGFPNLEELLGITFDVTRDDNPNRRVVESRAPFILEDAPKTYAEFRREPHAQAGIRSWLGVPMVVGERLIGMIALDKREPGFYTEAHARLAEAFAAQAAVVLENARLYDAARRRAQQLALVAQIAEQIASILDPDELLQTVVERIVEGFGHDYAAIMLFDPETDELVFSAGAGVFAGRTPEGFRQKLKEGMIGWAAHLGETILANDVSQEPRYVAPYLHETQSELDVPLKRGDRLIGVLDIQSVRRDAFEEQDVQAMEALAGHIATAIENARLHAELQAYAEELEQRVEERTAELRRERGRIQAILDAAGEGIFVTDLRGRIQYVNPAAERMTGYRLEELQGQRVWDVLAAGEEEVERAWPTGQALHTGGTWRGELRLRRKDGRVFDAAIVVTLLPGEEGRPSGAVGVVEDVTPFRELDRMKTRFIHNISHEFRTPLAAAKLYIELARRQPDRQAGYLDAADAQIDHLTALVEDILKVARIDAGGVSLERRVVSLNNLVTLMVERYRVLAEGKDLRMEHHPGEPDVVVEVDPEQIGQVVDNLLSNAVRYTPSGGRVEVTVDRAEAEGRAWARITVSDTGIGIPEDELPHIFDRFYRGEEPRRMQVPGTGLGLAIVKEVVEMHGGFVTVESEVGKGSTFTVWLPLGRTG